MDLFFFCFSSSFDEKLKTLKYKGFTSPGSRFMHWVSPWKLSRLPRGQTGSSHLMEVSDLCHVPYIVGGKSLAQRKDSPLCIMAITLPFTCKMYTDGPSVSWFLPYKTWSLMLCTGFLVGEVRRQFFMLRRIMTQEESLTEFGEHWWMLPCSFHIRLEGKVLSKRKKKPEG